MRIEKRKTIIESDVYIAADGREFDDRDSCEQYENDVLFDLARERIRGLPQFSMEPPACDYYADYTWIRLESEEDLAALKLAEFQLDSVAHGYNAPGFPCWVLYHTDDCADGYITGTLNELSNEFLQYYGIVMKTIEEIEGVLHNGKDETNKG